VLGLLGDGGEAGLGGTGGTGGGGGSGGSGGDGGAGGVGGAGGGCIVFSARGILQLLEGVTINISASTPTGGGSGASGGASSSATSGGNGGDGGAGGKCGQQPVLPITLSVANGGDGGDGADGGDGGKGAAGGTGGTGGTGGHGAPGMVKLSASVISVAQGANAARITANNGGTQSGRLTCVSNMTSSALASNQPAATGSLVRGNTTNDSVLKSYNAYSLSRTPLIPNLDGGPAANGWCLDSYWNQATVEALSPTGTIGDLRYWVFASVFDGFDQIVIKNTSASTALQDVTIKIGANRRRLIRGANGDNGELLAGQSWSTSAPTGSTIVVDQDGEGAGEAGSIYESDGHLGDLTVTSGTITIDTGELGGDQGTMTAGGTQYLARTDIRPETGEEVAVFEFEDIKVTGATFSITGARPLSIAASGDMDWGASMTVPPGSLGGGAGGTGGEGGAGGTGGTGGEGGTGGAGGSGGVGGGATEVRGAVGNGANGTVGYAGVTGDSGNPGNVGNPGNSGQLGSLGFGSNGSKGTGGTGGADAVGGAAGSGGSGGDEAVGGSGKDVKTGAIVIGSAGGDGSSNAGSAGSSGTSTGAPGVGSDGLTASIGGNASYSGIQTIAKSLTLIAGNGGGGGGGGGGGAGGGGGGGGGGGSGGSGGGGGSGAFYDGIFTDYATSGGGGGGGPNGPGANGSRNASTTWPASPAGGIAGATGGTGGTGGTGATGGSGGAGGTGAPGGGALILASKGLLRFVTASTLDVSAGTPGNGASGSSAGSSPLGATSGSSGLSGSDGGTRGRLNVADFSAGDGGDGADGGKGGNGAAGAAGGKGGTGATGGLGTPGMVKLHGSVVLATSATINAGKAADATPDNNGAWTVISNMNDTSLETYKPKSGTSGLVSGYSSHDALLKVNNPYLDIRSPRIPNLVGGPAAAGWCLPSYFNSGQENPVFGTNNGLEYRVFRNSEGASIFNGFDQVVIRNTDTSAAKTGVSIVIGANPEELIDGEGGVAGELAAGQTWTTTVIAGTSVLVPGASGSGGQGDGPTAAFTAVPTSGGKPLVVLFGDQSTPGTYSITEWTWDFGDGEQSSTQNPTHAYTAAGTYTVTLTVKTEAGTSTKVLSNYITVTEPVGPTASFEAGPTSGDTGLTVQFGDTSTPGSTQILGWLWDFGDGSTSTSQSPSHKYATAGVFTVSLTVNTTIGSDSEVKSDLITVTTPGGPTAAFNANPVAGLAPLTVQFADLSTAGSSLITGWSWVFGDGATSTEKSPTHIYAATGAYDVSLTVTTAVGQSVASKPAYIAVSAQGGPTAAFIASQTTGVAPFSVQFASQSVAGTSPIVSWNWDFGDGSTSMEQAPSHVYTTSGAKTVTLTVNSATGSNSSVKTDYLTVAEPVAPIAGFSANVTTGLTPMSVQFVDQSIAGTSIVKAWLWNFGDGFTSTEASPSHVYSNSGVYTVSLTVTTDAGADTEVKNQYINASSPTLPDADFTASPLTGTSPLSVQFASQSTAGSSPITAWSWNFGDGSTVSSLQAPRHTYTKAGYYDVTLTVQTARGSDTERKNLFVTVNAGETAPSAAFQGTPTYGTSPLTVQFSDSSIAGTSSITAWYWDFGDGSTSTQQNPSHVYTAAGSYTVSLRVTTSVGADTTSVPSYVVVEDTAEGVPAMGLAGLFAAATTLLVAGASRIRRKR
jgi:PKD repeat protein